MRIDGLDHLVLTVRSIEETIRFYGEVLGMPHESFGAGRVALRCGAQKINLHELGREFEPRAAHPAAGAGDLCFFTETSLEAAMSHVRDCGVEIIGGPVTRTGARGPMRSFYFRDPDDNLVEVASYREAAVLTS